MANKVIPPKLYIITGTSGTGIEPALEKYTAAHGGHVVRLERHLVDRASEVFGKTLTMIELFCKPEGVLRDLWVDACESARQDVEQHLEDSDVFLRLNAAWYHVLSGGFVSGLHIPTLTKLPQPSLVVTLIDDIYDVLARLQRPEKIFEHFDRGETITSVLMKLLAWRELEVRQAQQIALSFDRVPYHLFPVKHPLATFAKLLRLPADAVTYLSHPIAVVRRKENVAGPPLENYIEDVSKVLRESPDLVLLEPTAIDEWRVDRHGRTGRVQTRELKPRWQNAHSEAGEPIPLLHDQLSDAEAARILQPFVDAEEDLAALKVLSNEIKKQVSWRDRMMVEQSARPIVVRPFAGERGKASGGVSEEHELHWELAEYFFSAEVGAFPHKGDRSVATVVRSKPITYHPPSDEKSRQIGAVIEIIGTYAQQGEVADWPTDEVAEGELRAGLRSALRQQDLEKWLELSDHVVGQTVNELLRLLPGRPPHVTGPPTGSTLDAGGGVRRKDEALRKVGADIQEAIRVGWSRSPQYSLSPFKRGHLVQEEMSAHDFASRALTQIALDRKEEAPDLLSEASSAPL